jgi:hypothetical protein
MIGVILFIVDSFLLSHSHSGKTGRNGSTTQYLMSATNIYQYSSFTFDFFLKPLTTNNIALGII